MEITPIKQRPNGCFPAVIAMLTGIDYDLLPNVTIAVDDTGKMYTDEEIRRFVVHPNDVYTVGWRSIQHYMRLNYGVALSLKRNKPKIAAGRLIGGWVGSHIVVELPSGQVIDPFDPTTPKSDAGVVASSAAVRMSPLDMWITVTKMQGHPAWSESI